LSAKSPGYPTFVVGRRAYDNWIVDDAYHNKKTGKIALFSFCLDSWEQMLTFLAQKNSLGTGSTLYSLL